MNRLKELRKAAGLSQGELAALVKPPTSATQISRLELSKRGLDMSWIERIAAALHIAPAELLAAPAMAGGEPNDAEPLNNGSGHAANVALAKRGIKPYRVLTDVVSRSGITPGTELMIEETPSAIQAATDGDVVLARMKSAAKRSASPQRLILRVLVCPALLVTNRERANLAVTLDDPSLSIEIVGVALKG